MYNNKKCSLFQCLDCGKDVLCEHRRRILKVLVATPSEGNNMVFGRGKRIHNVKVEELSGTR